MRKRLVNPHAPGSALHDELLGCYKIKLNKLGYRLIYSVENQELVLLVIALDKRENSVVYESAKRRKK